ncbi:MAG: hypothetical protein KKF68_01080 [Nanoarchaeota archaeon]|nr:hypothetical protein [Nanoarchaeota archaeon]
MSSLKLNRMYPPPERNAENPHYSAPMIWRGEGSRRGENSKLVKEVKQ